MKNIFLGIKMKQYTFTANDNFIQFLRKQVGRLVKEINHKGVLEAYKSDVNS